MSSLLSSLSRPLAWLYFSPDTDALIFCIVPHYIRVVILSLPTSYLLSHPVGVQEVGDICVLDDVEFAQYLKQTSIAEPVDSHGRTRWRLCSNSLCMSEMR